MRPGKDLGASVAARLLQRSRESGEDYQTLLSRFCLERLLFRLGASEVRERFVLKGATLLAVWSERPYRATRDLDLLRHGEGSLVAARDDLRAILDTAVAPDGVRFDGDSVRFESIGAQDESGGVRARLTARCGKARLDLQVDVGMGDVVWPAPVPCSYPALLEFPAPNVLAYPHEAVVAEKLEALVVLGDRNSRIKDFFDLHYMAEAFEYDRATLSEAVRRTFERRRTPIPGTTPIGLTRAYWENPARPAQTRAFALRAGLALPDDFAEASPRLLHAFLGPILEDLRGAVGVPGIWPRGGPWSRVER